MAKSKLPLWPLILSLVLGMSVSEANVSCRSNPTSRVSLRDPGKPLHGYVVQDQDGLATCYANVLAAMIYAETGKELSSHQLATMYGMSEQGVQPNAGSGGARVSAILNSQNIEAMGTVCGTYNVVKQKPYLCTRQQVPIESMSNDSRNMQREYNSALANFYDHSAGLRNLSAADRSRVARQLREMRTEQLNNMTGDNNEMYQQCNARVEDVVGGNLATVTTDGLSDYLQEACMDQYNELTSYVREKTIVDAQIANARTPEAERAGLAERRDALNTSIERQRDRMRALGAVHYRMPNQGGNIATLPSDADLTGNLPARATPRCVFNQNIETTLRTQFYRDVYAQFNEKGHTESIGLVYPWDDGGTRRPEGRITPPVQNFMRGLGNISGDSEWPQALFAQNGGMMSENQLHAILNQDINMMIPSECSASGIEGEGITDAMVTTDLRGRGICLPTATNSALNQLLRSLGMGPQQGFPNNGQLDVILTNIDKPYDEFLMGVIGPGCMNNTSGRVEGSEYNNMTCKPDNLDRLNTTVMQDYWRSLSEEEKITLILAILAEADPSLSQDAARTEITADKAKWLSNTAAGHPVLSHLTDNRAVDRIFTRRITGTAKGRQVREERVRTRLNGAVQTQLANNHPVAVSLCAGVLYDNNFDSQYTSRNCSGNGLRGDSGRHSVLIIGQRCNARGQIEYQIQNSWGNNCTNPQNECVPAEGTMWLSEAALARNLDEIQTLTPAE